MNDFQDNVLPGEHPRADAHRNLARAVRELKKSEGRPFPNGVVQPQVHMLARLTGFTPDFTAFTGVLLNGTQDTPGAAFTIRAWKWPENAPTQDVRQYFPVLKQPRNTSPSGVIVPVVPVYAGYTPGSATNASVVWYVAFYFVYSCST